MAKKTRVNKPWTKEEDEKLARVIIEGARKGELLNKAFENAEKELGRTKGSIAYRWNNNLKKEYLKELVKAREGKSARKEKQVNNNSKKDVEERDKYKETIDYIRELKEENERLKRTQEKHDTLRSNYEGLKNAIYKTVDYVDEIS